MIKRRGLLKLQALVRQFERRKPDRTIFLAIVAPTGRHISDNAASSLPA
jgi:3-deoxy-D-manno-octulosonic-acid transferase